MLVNGLLHCKVTIIIKVPLPAELLISTCPLQPLPSLDLTSLLESSPAMPMIGTESSPDSARLKEAKDDCRTSAPFQLTIASSAPHMCHSNAIDTLPPGPPIGDSSCVNEAAAQNAVLPPLPQSTAAIVESANSGTKLVIK